MKYVPGWSDKGATFSDKSARKEFEISQEDIIEGIRDGSLQYQENHIHGNPYFRLFRHEVEAFIIRKYGEDCLKKKKLDNELRDINSELRKIKSRMKKLEKRKAELNAYLEK